MVHTQPMGVRSAAVWRQYLECSPLVENPVLSNTILLDEVSQLRHAPVVPPTSLLFRRIPASLTLKGAGVFRLEVDYLFSV